ncbi:MAG TPA: phosphatidylserine decarboxylase [Clostridium sp.]|nr:phosphatidylserine decarboxylase [Clostridium sp.]
MIKVYNRQTKKYDIEKIAGGKVIEVLYSTSYGKIGLELILKRKIYSVLAGILSDSRISAAKIKKFIQKYNIDMSEFHDELSDFKSFNDFFTRKIKPCARPFSKEPKFFLSPGDGRIQGWMNVNINKNIHIKGISYTLKDLIPNNKIIEEYDGGTVIILRLNPTDYHRFHFIDDGICSESKRIKGHYYSVNPVALLSYPKVFCQNVREYSILKSKNYGELIYIEVGATCVGSIVQTYKPGEFIKRGSEKGFFKFGGSTIIILIKKDRVKLDEDILYQTKLGYETKIKAGEVIGRSRLE